MSSPWKNTVGPYATGVATAVAALQSPGAGAILINGTLATSGVATLALPQRLLFTSGASDAGITFTITGTGPDGATIRETIQGGVATAVTTQTFKTVSAITHTGSVAGTLTVGTQLTGGVASTPWFVTNWHVADQVLGIAVIVSGGVNYSVDMTMEDPARPLGYPPVGVFNPDNPKTVFPTVFNIGGTSTANAVYSPFATIGTISVPLSVAAVRLSINSASSGATASIVVLQPGLGFQG